MTKFLMIVGISLLMTVLLDFTLLLPSLSHLGVKYVPAVTIEELAGLSEKDKADLYASRAVPVTARDLLIIKFTPPSLWRGTVPFYAVCFAFFLSATVWAARCAVGMDRRNRENQQIQPIAGKPGSD